MTTFAEQCEAARRECYQARDAARRDGPSARAIVAQYTARRQQRDADGLDAKANLWGSPPTGGLSRNTPVASRRNTRFIT